MRRTAAHQPYQPCKAAPQPTRTLHSSAAHPAKATRRSPRCTCARSRAWRARPPPLPRLPTAASHAPLPSHTPNCRSTARLTAVPFATQVAEAARAAGIKRIWYASSACIYPESKQTDENLGGASGLKEDDAWPAQPQAPG